MDKYSIGEMHGRYVGVPYEFGPFLFIFTLTSKDLPSNLLQAIYAIHTFPFVLAFIFYKVFEILSISLSAYLHFNFIPVLILLFNPRPHGGGV